MGKEGPACYDPRMAPPSTTAALASQPRPVLVWNADGDETHIHPTVAQAARFLEVSEDAVLQAIKAGDELHGWFVDWEAPAPAKAE